MTYPSSSSIETSISSPSLTPCPDWAHEMIGKIYILEVEAGTIKHLGSENEKWSTAQIDELSKIASGIDRDNVRDIENEVEALFTRVVRGLVEEKFSIQAIATLINERIPTGCRLPYCNSLEVEAAFH